MKPARNINKSQSFKITKKPITEPVQKSNPNSKKKKSKTPRNYNLHQLSEFQSKFSNSNTYNKKVKTTAK